MFIYLIKMYRFHWMVAQKFVSTKVCFHWKVSKMYVTKFLEILPIKIFSNLSFEMLTHKFFYQIFVDVNMKSFQTSPMLTHHNFLLPFLVMHYQCWMYQRKTLVYFLHYSKKHSLYQLFFLILTTCINLFNISFLGFLNILLIYSRKRWKVTNDIMKVVFDVK